jgi:hypothetical protein
MKAFVLYIEHDIGPHCVSVHKTLAGAERALLEYGEDVLKGEEEFPTIEKLTDKLAEYNEYARIYECGGHGGSIEVEPFEQDKPELSKNVTYYAVFHSEGSVAAFPAFSFAQAVTIKNNLQAEYNEAHDCDEVFEMREITREAFERRLETAVAVRLTPED